MIGKRLVCILVEVGSHVCLLDTLDVIDTHSGAQDELEGNDDRLNNETVFRQSCGGNGRCLRNR